MAGSFATAPRTPTGPSFSSSSAALRLNILGKLAAARALHLTPRGDSLEHLRWLESDEPFTAAGVMGLLEGVPDAALSATAQDVAEMEELLAGTEDAPLDACFMNALPRRARHASGAYFTPRWLADHVLDRAGFDGRSFAHLLDPMCGAGIFLVAALERMRAAQPEAPVRDYLNCLAGVEQDPVSALAARAAVLGCVADRIVEPIRIPVLIGDAIADADGIDLPRHGFDLVAGNPPWIGWESLPPEIRALTRPLWERHGLFSIGGRGAGMDALLGRGRKDLCMLATYVAADRWLKPGGRLSFVISQTIFKSVGSAAGFRRLQLADGTPLGVLSVDDFTGRQIFAGASARVCVLTLEKGRATSWPVRYRQMRRDEPPRDLAAQPIDPEDAGSAWMTAAPERLAALHGILGPSAYRARAGAYTGGANGVYWVRLLERRDDGTALVENIPEAGKREVPQVRALVESALLFPLLRASGIGSRAVSAQNWILLPQDPDARRGIDEAMMREQFPLALAWLELFQTELAQRRDRGTRSLIASGAPFYSIFSVSRATLAPWKVVWPRIASSLRAVAIGPAGGLPVVPQETCTFIPCDSAQPEQEAHYLAGLLSSALFNEAAASFAQVGGKSFGSPHLLRHIAVPRFDPVDPAHCALADLVRMMGPVLNDPDQHTAAARIWNQVAATILI